MTQKTAEGQAGDPHAPGAAPRSSDVWEEIKRHIQQDMDKPVRSKRDFDQRLEQLRRTYKQGEFSEPVKTACLNMFEYITGGGQLRQTTGFWRAGTLVYELADSFNVSQEIKEWAAAEGKTLYDRQYRRWEADRKRLSAEPPKAKQLMREHVMFITCYGNELKRRGDYAEALGVFETLYEFTTEVLVGDDMPCNATRAILSYHLGGIRRLREELSDAEEMYLRALDFYYRRSMTRQEDLEEFFFVTRRVAMCVGLGLGWINLTRSYLRRAGHALATSRALLAHIPDPLVRSFVDMLYGTIKRVRAGSDREELLRAIDMLTRAHDEFEKHGHQRYRMHASYELALAYNLTKEFEEAERYLSYVEEHAGNDKWKANVYILRSRIRRGEGKLEEALSEASRAVVVARSSKLNLPMADAYITRGEVKFYLAERDRPRGATYAEALKDFEKAHRKSQPGAGAGGVQNLNQKLVSVCSLRLAHCHVREGAWGEAHANLKRWWELKPLVEHEWVHELAAVVEEEFKDMKEDFVVPANDPKKWNYRERAEKLQGWLLTQAEREAKGDVAAMALMLGYSENRVKQLLKERREGKKAEAGA